MASLTRDPLVVAVSAMLRWAPPLLFGLTAGVLSDRLDRRRIVMAADRHPGRWCSSCSWARIVTGTAERRGAPWLRSLVLATAEVFAENARRPRCCRCWSTATTSCIANARLQAGFVTAQPAGRAADRRRAVRRRAAWPFVTEAVLVVRGVVLVSRVALPAARRRPRAQQTASGAEIAGRRALDAPPSARSAPWR